MNKLPTAMELWFEGSFVARSKSGEIFRKGDSYYLIVLKTEQVVPASDKMLELMLA